MGFFVRMHWHSHCFPMGFEVKFGYANVQLLCRPFQSTTNKMSPHMLHTKDMCFLLSSLKDDQIQETWFKNDLWCQMHLDDIATSVSRKAYNSYSVPMVAVSNAQNASDTLEVCG